MLLRLPNYVLKNQVTGNTSCLESPYPHLFSYHRAYHSDCTWRIVLPWCADIQYFLFRYSICSAAFCRWNLLFCALYKPFPQSWVFPHLAACQLSTTVFEPISNFDPTIPKLPSQYSLSGEPCNTPLPLHHGSDWAASSAVLLLALGLLASRCFPRATHHPAGWFTPQDLLNLYMTLHHSGTMRGGGCLIPVSQLRHRKGKVKS